MSSPDRHYKVKAWSADDAFVQSEVALGIRGSQFPLWKIVGIQPFYLEPWEALRGEEIVARDAT
jgi:hypothetical protein